MMYKSPLDEGEDFFSHRFILSAQKSATHVEGVR